jgi:heme-degrading monooxygenase HmoA
MRRVATPGVGPIGREPEIVHVLGNVRIEQLERFVGVFSTAGAEARRRHGSRGAQLFRVAGEEGRVVVLFEWESEEAFEAFRNDPSVKETMRSSGTVGPPEFTFLEKVGEFPS